MRVLNIEVGADLVTRWVHWFTPAVQPFVADADLAARVEAPIPSAQLSAEVRDTYCLYGLPTSLQYVWLDEARFLRLPRAERAALVRAQRRFGREGVPSVRRWRPVVGDALRAQADGHRFVWWRSLLAGCEENVLTDYVEDGRRPSRHDEVPDDLWNGLEDRLPSARRLAGTFPTASGPNCFGKVMAAAGVDGADDVWMLREPFERWLRETTRRGGDDDAAGTVLLWRSPDGRVQHAAVTLGGGWVLHKPSQGWMSPTKVLTVDECKASAREVGRRLERHALMA